ncbi:MAG: isoprenylcysteine carboxylmethyltransferase family protein [Deltaproteobacteria bacterium]|nr:isoprenylcysteine carboxylmethyltransferase family protein [Deltaproteobacteria bacterium]
MILNPWFGKALTIAGIIVTVAIRVPHDGRSAKVPVVDSRKGTLEVVLLALMSLGIFVLPILSIATPFLSFANYPLHPMMFGAGVACLGLNFWLFYRSHADLGTNWSMTLEVRDGHQLISSGVYGRIRHPMYAAIYLYALAQAFLLPNWIAGPASLVTFTLMFALRLRPEEKMMIDKFGSAYRDYASRTKRLIPGVW